jgi:hypothetical protein
LPKSLEVRDPLILSRRFVGDALGLDVSLVAGKTGQPEIKTLVYKLSRAGNSVLKVHLSRGEDGKLELDSDNFRFVKADGRKWPLDDPEKFYRVSDVSMARFKNAGFLADFALATEAMLGNLSYLGPLRQHPKRIYQWSGDTPEDVGQMGEATIAAILAAQNDNRTLNRGPKKSRLLFAEFIASWLKDLGVIQSFVVKPVAEGRKEYEVLVKTSEKTPEVKITDVGFGVSQVLPALVQAFYCPPNSTIWMEQPEIHLHPQVQAELADVFISAIRSREKSVNRNIQLIIESHSEHLLNRLQRRIAEGVIKPEDVAIYFCKRSNGGAELEPLRVNLYGDIENWPENFFGDEMAEIAARTTAAMKRQMEEYQ